MVVYGRDAVLQRGKPPSPSWSLVVGAIIHGQVEEAVVAVGGDVEIDGQAAEVRCDPGQNHDREGRRCAGDAVAVGGGWTLPKAVVWGGEVVQWISAPWIEDTEGLKTWFLQCV